MSKTYKRRTKLNFQSSLLSCLIMASKNSNIVQTFLSALRQITFPPLSIFFSLTITPGQIVTDDITYSINVNTSQYTLGDTIHWSIKMVNISEDIIEFEDHTDGHFYNWMLIDSAQTTGDGWVYLDCTTVYIIPPGDSLTDEFPYVLHDWWFINFPLGLYYGLMKPWYIYDSLGWDTVSFHVYEQLSIGHQQEPIPKEYQLYQSYPNPFNPLTTIRYDLPIQTEVKLSIYNIMGQEVAVLLDKTQNAGSHAVKWNASDMASGIYFYLIKTDHFSAVRKLVLLK